MNRHYDLEVVAKWEGTHGWGSIMLRPPQINGEEVDPHKPFWVDKTPSGAPLTMYCTPDEMAEVTVGTRFTVELVQMTSVGEESARRASSAD